MRREQLVRRIQAVPLPAQPEAALEQVGTPAEAAADLLLSLHRHIDLAGRSVVDLGCGTGRLAIGAALLGAHPVLGVEVDPSLVSVAEAAALTAGVDVDFRVSDVARWSGPADMVVMNPPFGAQTRHADRPFWERALTLAHRSVGAFASSASRTFIARLALDRAAHVVEVEPVAWGLPRTFPHHRRANVRLAVDRWLIDTGTDR
ncbi:MAG TPA: METTL5 family protein [Thermoplasmata archaeon]|nr:METTL5 family protein [Thermoplasmata archaeon]